MSEVKAKAKEFMEELDKMTLLEIAQEDIRALLKEAHLKLTDYLGMIVAKKKVLVLSERDSAMLKEEMK